MGQHGKNPINPGNSKKNKTPKPQNPKTPPPPGNPGGHPKPPDNPQRHIQPPPTRKAENHQLLERARRQKHRPPPLLEKTIHQNHRKSRFPQNPISKPRKTKQQTTNNPGLLQNPNKHRKCGEAPQSNSREKPPSADPPLSDRLSGRVFSFSPKLPKKPKQLQPKTQKGTTTRFSLFLETKFAAKTLQNQGKTRRNP